MKFIIKRDGRRVAFDRKKIEEAILKSFFDVDGDISEFAETKAKNIADYIENQAETEELTVENIQDLVENGLMSTKRKDVAKSYIKYRYDHEKERNRNTKLMRTMKEKIEATNVQNQNANVDERSFGGRVGEASDTFLKQYALDYCMSEMSRDNHLNNEIYIHDLSSYAIGNHNCLTVPFDELLAKGFKTRQVDIRPANSINTAMQLVAVIFQLQSLMQFGGCSASHLDWTMVPYVRKSFHKHYRDAVEDIYEIDPSTLNVFDKNLKVEELSIEDERYHLESKAYSVAMKHTLKELQQGVEGLYHNLNSLQSRSGNQLPFTSLNYGTCTLEEGRMVIKALLEGSINGVGKFHRTPIFPCGIFKLKKGINRHPGDPNYDLFQLALKSTAQRLYPNYINVDWSGNAGYDPNNVLTEMSSMGCRTNNGFDINGFGQLKDGRGNICPVTIILPTLAMEAKELSELNHSDIVEEFIKILDIKINEAKEMLIERFEHICSQSPASAKFMYENNIMAGYIPEEGIRSALIHGTLAVGQLGLAETLEILIGCNHTTEKGMKLAKRIEQLFKDKCAKFKETYKLNFGVYYSPAENLCYTAMKKFKEKYGEIPKVSDKKFFTNSMHVPVWEEISIMEKIDIESQLTGYSSAGCITYVELDGTVNNNLQALETIVNYAMDKDIPYFAINIPVDTCIECGYTGELGNICPQCGSSKIERLRRVTGYLTGSYTDAFNLGKQQEVEMRYKHSNRTEIFHSRT